MVCDRFIVGHQDCDLRRQLDSVPPDTPIRDIVDRCRVWESQSVTHNKYRRLPTVTDSYRPLLTVTDSYRGASNITSGLPVVTEVPLVEPIVLVATVWTAPLAGPTVLDALTRKLLDQTVNCSEGSSVCTGPRSTEPVTQSTGSGSVFSRRSLQVSKRC